MKAPILRSTGSRIQSLGVFMVAAVLLLSFRPVPAVAAGKEDIGQLAVVREHMNWPSPASVVGDLNSQNEDVRLKALLLIGVPDKLARLPVWNSAAPPEVIGTRVVKAEQVELRFAALGNDETPQAIVVAQVMGIYAFAAVATPMATRWERIATFNCWCKYDAPTVVDTFVSLNRAPDPMGYDEPGRYELVLRASGGGTGLYQQEETHFRLYRGEMKAVMSFVGRVQATPGGIPPPRYLAMERRWFYPSLPVSHSDGSNGNVAVLAESRGKTAVLPTVYFLIQDLQDRFLSGVTCRTFRWNQKLFQYEPVSVPNACKSADQ